MIRLLPIILLGCAKEEVDEAAIEGRISISQDELDESAAVAWNQGFYAVSEGSLIVFLTGVSGANCTDISEFLASSGGASEKAGIYDGGGCVMTVKVPSWTGSYETQWPGADSNWNPAVDSSIRCEFGSGDWVLEANSTGREDYYWTGTTWAGWPDVFDWAFEEAGDDLEISMNMSSYEGSLLYESTGNVVASGSVSGTIRAQSCSGLQGAGIL